MAKRLLETQETFKSVAFGVSFIYVALLGFGFTKVFVGLSRDKPVGILIFLIFLNLFIGILLMYRPKRTKSGDACLNRYAGSTKKTADTQTQDFDPSIIAITGLLATDAAIANDVQGAMQKSNPGVFSGDGGCGSWGGGDSGCGGGGCGGGGCGGCGG